MSPLPLGAINVLISESFLCVLATTSVGLRFLSIHRLRRNIRLHDWLTVVALVCLYGYALCTMIGAGVAGYGSHIEDVLEKDPSQVVIALKIFFAATPFWLTSSLAFRSAILVLYIELFGRTKAFKYCCYALEAIVVLFFIGGWATILRLCTPIEYNWDKTLNGSCGDENAALIGSAVINTILDVLIVVVPLPVVWGLQMVIQKKIAISATFALGLGICGFNVSRLVITKVCDSSDLTYCIPYSFIFTLCELATGVLVACVPTLGPVLFPRRHRSTNTGSSKWKHIKSDTTGKQLRSTGTVGSVHTIVPDDQELQHLHQGSTVSKTTVSSDPRRSTEDINANVIHVHSQISFR